MSEETDHKFAECLAMADEARRKADNATSPEDARFWFRMEQRWLRLAKTYQETEQLTDSWLRATPGETVAIRT
jgi:hypothetical protein